MLCGNTVAAPSRIASLNLCTDSMLFELVAANRIVSVTQLSRDESLSYYAHIARGIPANHGQAEEIIPLRPDLILGGLRAAATSIPLLERLGWPVLTFEPAESIDQFRQNFLRLAQAVGETPRARNLLAAFDRRLVQSKTNTAATRRSAVVYQANGYVAGSKTLIGAVIDAAGLHNGATELGLLHGGFVSLERLILAHPDLIVFGRGTGSYPSLADHLLKHPALVMSRTTSMQTARARHITIPTNLWTCGGTFLSVAVDQLALAARASP